MFKNRMSLDVLVSRNVQVSVDIQMSLAALITEVMMKRRQIGIAR